MKCSVPQAATSSSFELVDTVPRGYPLNGGVLGAPGGDPVPERFASLVELKCTQLEQEPASY